MYQMRFLHSLGKISDILHSVIELRLQSPCELKEILHFCLQILFLFKNICFLIRCYVVMKEALCPICKKKLIEHSELQDKVCKMITIKQFANNCLGFEVQFRPFFEE